VTPLRIAPLTSDDQHAWADLLAIAFARQPAEMIQLLAFLQAAAPLIAYGAWDGSRLAAQYSCLLRQVHVPDQSAPVKVGVSLNMAVHPQYRGRGLIKQVAGPVYTAVQAHGGVAGVGFSNAAGVKVDKHSKGYGYRVVGQLNSMVALLLRPSSQKPLSLTTTWPTNSCWPSFAHQPRHHFITTPEWLAQRYAHHPFRHYHFAASEGQLVVYRPFRWHGLPGASLLAAQGQELTAVLGQWSSALWQQGVRLIHVLTSPRASLLAALRETAVCLRLPYSRSPYYLTAKALNNETPQSLFDFARWDCTGGDVL
jgi:GNAT superfamily N-acetyltransferase